MRLTREEFEVKQRKLVEEEFFDLLSDERGELADFVYLSLETFDVLGRAKVWTVFHPIPENDLSPWRLASVLPALPLPLQQQWQGWREAYSQLKARNPRMRLAELMRELSESHNAMSWPIGWEDKIWRWLDGDDESALPFDDRRRVVTADFRLELKSLRDQIDGWLWFDESLSTVRFSPVTEWLEMVTAREEESLRIEHSSILPRYADYKVS